MSISFERESVIGSDLFEPDDYIKQYPKENPDLPLHSVIKIIFRYCITPRLIAEMEEFKLHLRDVNFFMFQEIFGKLEKRRKYG